MTNSADELKSLLLLAYTGNLEESRSIIGYLELCERFDMPLGHAVCSRALPKFFAKTLLQPNIDVNQQKALQQIFIEAFEKTTSTEVHQAVLNVFRMHPLLFNAPLCMKDLDTQPFGFHSFAYDYNYSELPGSKNSYDKHPPGQWKVCALTGHVSRSWDGRQVLAGLDITYQNLITGRKEEVLWGHENDRLYTKHTIQVPEDDVITGAIINSGWLIDKLVFTTLRGMHMDALGGSDGGNRTVVEPSNFWRDKKSKLQQFGGAVIELRGYGSPNLLNREKYLYPDEFLNVYVGSGRLREKCRSACYAHYCDIYKNSMADLPHATRITMLLREFNRSDHDLCSSYFQPMDPIDLTYEKIMGIVNRLYTSFRFGSLKENHFKYLIFILGPRSPCHAEIRLGPLSLLDKKPDVKKSRR
ncbi:unnamed protein product [Hymenolepis diminuta]|uniref:Uncharacterized protein n=1 Tax=Hymenolepis diminuta TaxID=6216 RepID=A0A3P6X5E3_HYMDI|nr:unnamed protein product [Hymenolepis diminuta]